MNTIQVVKRIGKWEDGNIVKRDINHDERRHQKKTEGAREAINKSAKEILVNRKGTKIKQVEVLYRKGQKIKVESTRKCRREEKIWKYKGRNTGRRNLQIDSEGKTT